MSKAFSKWYEKNKKTLSEARKTRYQNDPAYRQAILDRAAALRESKNKDVAPVPSRFEHTIASAAKELNVSESIIRRWRFQDYFPEPFSLNNRLYFTKDQVELLKPLAEFFSEKTRRRLSAQDTAKLETIKAVIYSNWV